MKTGVITKLYNYATCPSFFFLKSENDLPDNIDYECAEEELQNAHGILEGNICKQIFDLIHCCFSFHKIKDRIQVFVHKDGFGAGDITEINNKIQ